MADNEDVFVKESKWKNVNSSRNKSKDWGSNATTKMADSANSPKGLSDAVGEMWKNLKELPSKIQFSDKKK